jgi:hypothetical protein
MTMATVERRRTQLATRRVPSRDRLNAQRRRLEETRRRRVLRKLEDLVADLKRNRCAWSQIEDDRVTESGRGIASTEEALTYFFGDRINGWPIEMDADLFFDLSERAEQLSAETGVPWNETDIVELVAETVERLLIENPDSTLAVLRQRLATDPRVLARVIDQASASWYECFIDEKLGSRLNSIAESAFRKMFKWPVNPGDIVRAYLLDSGFVSILVGSMRRKTP